MAEKNMNAKISVEFEETANRQQLSSGDNLPTLFGKIKKIISDLANVCFSGSYNDLSDTPDVVTKEYVDPIKSQAAINRTTLGTQCKNLIDTQIDSQTYYGLTFKRNSDGSILINGTSTNKSTAFLRIFKTYDVGKFINQKFILSATRSDNVGIQFDGRNSSGLQTCSSQAYSVDAKFTSNADFILLNIYLIIRANSTFDNYTVYPMLRYADITDGTYEPYKESVDERLIQNKSDIAVNKTTLGTQCKNLLKNNAVTKTVNGVTFTVNDDKSITVNGTATAQISFMINNKVGLGIGNYILTGCPSGGSWNTFYLTAYASSAWLSAPDFGSGCRIENKTVTQVIISIASGYTANNLKFYPMLRYADILDDTYEPYQPSLQEQVTALEERIAALGG